MRLSEERIKAAILHPEEEVRLKAVTYFAQSIVPDETVMPLVIAAVEERDQRTAFRILRRGDRLAQTPETLEWLLGELRKDHNLRDIVQDNYRFAVALMVVYADPELLVRRHKEILALPAFPGQLHQALADQLRFHLMDWPDLWSELEQFGLETMKRDVVTLEEHRYVHQLIDAMGRHPEQGEKVILALDQKVAKTKRRLMTWLDAELVALAGRMRLKKAVPRIMRRISEGEEAVLDECGTALGNIGTDVVVEEIAHSWRKSDGDLRLTLCEALGDIHTDLCVRRCMEFLAEEEDFEIAMWLAGSMLSHFCSEGVENACQLVMDDPEDLDPDQRDLKFHAVAVATAMDMDFPDYEQWHEEAIATNYGWGDLEDERISEHF